MVVCREMDGGLQAWLGWLERGAVWEHARMPALRAPGFPSRKTTVIRQPAYDSEKLTHTFCLIQRPWRLFGRRSWGRRGPPTHQTRLGRFRRSCFWPSSGSPTPPPSNQPSHIAWASAITCSTPCATLSSWTPRTHGGCRRTRAAPRRSAPGLREVCGSQEVVGRDGGLPRDGWWAAGVVGLVRGGLFGNTLECPRSGCRGVPQGKQLSYASQRMTVKT